MKDNHKYKTTMRERFEVCCSTITGLICLCLCPCVLCCD